MSCTKGSQKKANRSEVRGNRAVLTTAPAGPGFAVASILRSRACRVKARHGAQQVSAALLRAKSVCGSRGRNAQPVRFRMRAMGATRGISRGEHRIFGRKTARIATTIGDDAVLSWPNRCVNPQVATRGRLPVPASEAAICWYAGGDHGDAGCGPMQRGGVLDRAQPGRLVCQGFVAADYQLGSRES